MEYNSLYEMTRDDHATREEVRLIFQPYNEGSTRFLGVNYEYDNEIDLQEMNKQNEDDIYNS